MLKTGNWGFDKERLIRVALQGDMKNHFHAIRKELIQTGTVEDAAASNQPIIYIGNNSANFFWKGQNLTKQVLISIVFSSSRLIETMGMQLIDGRDFGANEHNEKNHAIINQKFAELMGEEGRVGGTFIRGEDQFEIIGIVKDFVYNNMYASPAPMVMFCDLEYAGMIMIRLKPTDQLRQVLNERSRYPQGNGGFGCRFGFSPDGRFYETGAFSRTYRYSCCMVDHASMAAGLFLPDIYSMVDFCGCGMSGLPYSIAYSRLASHVCSNCRSGKKHQNGIKHGGIFVHVNL